MLYASLYAVMNISFAAANIEVVEGVGIVSLTLLKTAGAVGPVSVQITTVDMTATGVNLLFVCVFHNVRL